MSKGSTIGAVLTLMLSMPYGAPASAQAPEPPAVFLVPDGYLRESADWPLVQRRNGERLVQIFIDAGQPESLRLEAALLLGELGYRPAIAEIIERIDLGDFKEPSACVRALASYGVTALPEVIEAYLEEEDWDRQSLLESVILVGGTHKTARRLATGMKSERSEEARAKLEELVEILGHHNPLTLLD